MELSLGAQLADVIGTELAGALETKGFTSLTQVQREVLEPACQGVDLRISSQTGSGKTIAIGLAVRDLVTGGSEHVRGNARPRVLVVVPTRELAKQVEEELTWFFAALGLSVASVTGGGGGGGYRDEMRAFRKGPAVVVGTPGRMLDHLERGAIDPSNVAAVALDEADRMLDLGFRDDILKIFKAVPEERRTLLVSATFPREVIALADRVQKNPVRVEGTPLGAANTDIEHLVHLVRPDERLAAMINLLLAEPGAQTLIFARTRADVSGITAALQDVGFFVGMLSGEMEQPERLRALAAFKSGTLDALVATDVAARGIDVQDVSRVIHVDPPNDPDAYTHRSGRTGRAGKKGTSSLLVSPAELVKASRLLSRARVKFRLEPVPAAEALRDARDQRLFDDLTRELAEGEPKPDARTVALAQRLAKSPDVVNVLARLVATAARERCEPRPITPIQPPQPRRPQRELPLPPRASERNLDRIADDRPPREHRERPAREDRPPREARPHDDAPRPQRMKRDPSEEQSWVPFHVSWGGTHGADPRRLVAMLCRRGNVDNRAIGAIRVDRTFSVVEIAADRAEEFERAASEPDPRDPRVTVRRFDGSTDRPASRAPTGNGGGGGGGGGHAPPRRPFGPKAGGKPFHGKKKFPPKPKPA